MEKCSPTSVERSQLSLRDTCELALMLANRADVFAGVVLVKKKFDKQPVAYAISDDQFDPSIDHIVGISAWGPFAEHRPGMWRLGGTSTEQYVLPLTGSGYRPNLGIPVIDCWTYRSDVIRSIMTTGVYMSYTGVSVDTMSHAMLDVARDAIIRVLRKSASDILTRAPRELLGKLRSLATVADQPTTTPKILSSASQELMSLSPSWREVVVSLTTNQGKPGPTLKEIVKAARCHYSTVRRVMVMAGIRAPGRGHRFTIMELDALIHAAEGYTSSPLRSQMIEGWTRLREQIACK